MSYVRYEEDEIVFKRNRQRTVKFYAKKKDILSKRQENREDAMRIKNNEDILS